MSIPEAIKRVLDSRGCTQTWVFNRMNAINPSLNMNKAKFSSIVCGNRKMSGDELLAFCKAIEINPDDLFSDPQSA